MIIHIVLVLIVIGVLLWLINTYIPIDATIKKLIYAVVIIGLVVWLLKLTGLWAYLTAIP